MRFILKTSPKHIVFYYNNRVPIDILNIQADNANIKKTRHSIKAARHINKLNHKYQQTL